MSRESLNGCLKNLYFSYKTNVMIFFVFAIQCF